MYRKKQYCTLVLVVINVLVFLWLSFHGMTENALFMLDNGAMYVPYIQEYGEYYRLVTSMFLHFGFEHLMNNMISLWFLGGVLEQEIGKIKFLLIYFLSGIAGNVVAALGDIYTGDYAVAAGASGAIFGIIGALLYIALRNHGRIGSISGKGIVLMVALSLYYGFTSTGIANLAHIGGLVTGFVLSVLLYRKRHKYEYYY